MSGPEARFALLDRLLPDLLGLLLPGGPEVVILPPGDRVIERRLLGWLKEVGRRVRLVAVDPEIRELDELGTFARGLRIPVALVRADASAPGSLDPLQAAPGTPARLVTALAIRSDPVVLASALRRLLRRGDRLLVAGPLASGAEEAEEADAAGEPLHVMLCDGPYSPAGGPADTEWRFVPGALESLLREVGSCETLWSAEEGGTELLLCRPLA